MAGASRELTTFTPSAFTCGAAGALMHLAPTNPRPAHACQFMVGYAGVTTASNSFAMDSLTESPTKRIEPTAGASGSTAGAGEVSYQGELRSQSLRKSHALRVTVPAVPVMVTVVA